MSGPSKYLMFGIVDAIETDHWQFVIDHIFPQIDTSPLSEEEISKAQYRLEKRNEYGQFDLDDPSDLLYGLDFLEKAHVVRRYEKFLDSDLRKSFVQAYKIVEAISPIRNDIVHGRPLDFEDRDKIYEGAKKLAVFTGIYPSLRDTLTTYRENPASLLRDNYFLIDTQSSPIWHNLPEAEHHETGFFARTKERAQLLRLINAREAVVTVLGYGGFGKTALTLQVLYDLISEGTSSFEGILWVSAKANKLVTDGIAPVSDTPKNSDELFAAAVQEFDSNSGDDASAALLQLAENNNIIIVIDNLETVLDEKIRKFSEDFTFLPQSKLIFTSRVPLPVGASVELKEFSEKAALGYLDKMIRSYDVTQLKNASGEQRAAYCKRTNNSPLLIKWVVLGVSKGADPAKMLANPQKALEFCLENVFSAMNATANKLAETLTILPDQQELVLATLLELDELEVKRGLSDLIKFNVAYFRRNEDRAETLYSLYEMPKSYVSRIKTQTLNNRAAVIEHFRRIRDDFERRQSGDRHRKFQARHVNIRNKGDSIVAPKLIRAIQLCKSHRFPEAYDLVDEAKLMDPTFSESYRIEAYIALGQGDLERATKSYHIASELDPVSPFIHYFFARFCLRGLKDGDRALDSINRAQTIDPESVEIQLEACQIKISLHETGAARKHLAELEDKISNEWCEKEWIAAYIHSFNIDFKDDTPNPEKPESKALLQELSAILSKVQLPTNDKSLKNKLRNLSQQLNKIPLDIGAELSQQIKSMKGHIDFLSGGDGTGYVSSPNSSQRDENSVGRGRGHFDKGYTFLCKDGEIHGYWMHESHVAPEDWEKIMDGAYCRFEETVDHNGRRNAVNVDVLPR
jgi:LuxR family transcriptional regulator, glucitol operon activator